MTFEQFKKDFNEFLENSNVNLGRRTTKTRMMFLQEAMAKFDAFASGDCDEKISKPTGSMDDRVLCIKPTDRKRVMDIGKGVSAMDGSESMRADEQLGRSPFAKKGNQDG